MPVIQTTRFGEMQIDELNIVNFSQGLPGFPDEKEFVFIPYAENSPFAFLQSLTNPDLTFVVANPFVFDATYSFTLDDSAIHALGLKSEQFPEIFVIVRIPEKVEEMTANFMAPLVINWQTKQGLQFVLEQTKYQVRQPLFTSSAVSAVEGGK